LSLRRLTEGRAGSHILLDAGLWSLAALMCGFFWEMWNAYSLSKWSYQVPYLDVLHVFEMPLAGYSGYLAFGLECAIAVDILKEMKK
jgi:hypothetical protein